MNEKDKKEYDINKQYVEVRQSGIHHKGVFASEDILKGTVIMEYTGNILSKEEAELLMELTAEKNKQNPEKFAATYVFELEPERYLDGDIDDNDAKYANHSCEPNCDVEIGKNSVWLITLKDVKKDEEITFNYGFELDDYHEHDFKYHQCKCGSKRCVGYILSEDEWHRISELHEKAKQYLK